jgi:hemoglobin
MTKRDVETRRDLEVLLADFYAKVFKDDLIAFFFIEVEPLNLETHLPVITDFWEAVVFGARSYRKNVMEIHQQISAKAAIEKKHLDRWVLLFTQTVDTHFEGPNATLMKQRAQSIATLMQIKLGGHSISKLSK